MNRILSTLIALFCVLLLLPATATATVGNYNFSQSNGNFSPIVAGTVLISSTSSVSSVDASPIGFSFPFNGTTYTDLGAAQNGYVAFGNASMLNGTTMLQNGTLNNLAAAFNLPLELGNRFTGNVTSASNVISNVSSLVGFGLGDVINSPLFPSGTVITNLNASNNSVVVSNPALSSGTTAAINVLNGEVRMQTIGTAPNRVCVIQWTHARKAGNADDDFNFQIRLQETTNQVNFVYGTMVNNTVGATAQIGLTGASRADFNIRETTNNWALTAASAANSGTMLSSLSVGPASGLTFSFNNCASSSIPNLTVSNNPGCSGSSNTISLVGSLNDATQWTWHKDSCNGPIVNVGASYGFNNPLSTTTYFVAGSGGCVGNNNTNCGSITLIVQPTPTLIINSTPASLVVCNGNAINLNASGADSITWSNGVLNGVNFYANTTNTYTVTGKNSTGCITTSTVLVTVGANNLTITATPSNTTVCSGSPITLNASGYSTISWSGGITNGTAFIPSVSGNYTVTGSDNSSCINTQIVSVTVIANPSISVSSFPASGIICSGNDATLTATGASTYVWTGGINNGIPFTPTANAVYTVTATSSAGCIGTATASMNVLTTPTVGATTIPAIGSACFGSSVTLNGNGANTYAWSGGASTINNGVSFLPATTATYTVVGTATNGCTATATKTFVISPIPTISIAVTPTNGTICPGQSLVLTASGGNTYSWAGGPGNVQNGVAFIPTISGTYTVTATSLGGCSKTATKTILVSSNPVINVNTTPSVLTICEGLGVTMNATGASNISWSGGIVNNVIFYPTASTVYTVTGTNASGCVGSATKLITVNPKPVLTLGTVPSNTYTICLNDSIKFQAAGAPSLVWSNGLFNNTYFKPTATAIYTVTGTSSAGCQTTSTIQIFVNPIPNISITSNPSTNSICEGESATLTVGGGDSYAWSGGISNGVSFTPLTTTTYTVTATATNACTNTQSVTVTVNLKPVISIANSPFNNTVCIGQAMIVNASATNGGVITWSDSLQNGVAFYPTSTATYTVTATTGVGCFTTSVVTVTVNPIPNITITSTPSVANVCPGVPVTLSATGAGTISWSSGIVNNQSFVPVSGIYTVTGSNSFGCSVTGTTEIIVFAAPTFNVASTPSGFQVCDGGSIALNATGNASYSWSNGVGNNVSFLAATAIYTVTGTTANNCSATSTVSVTVLAKPIITITTSTGSTTICNGASIALTATGAPSISWTSGVVNSVSFIPSTSSIYTVTVIGANGCTQQSAVNISVNATPILTVTSVPGSPSICNGTSISLNASGANTYSWSGGIQNGVSFTPTSIGTTIYTVTGSNTNGCSSVISFPVTVNAIPAVTINSSPASGTICAGQQLTLTAVGASTYSWSGAVTNGVSFTPPNSGVYTVTGTSTAGCKATTTIFVTINAVPSGLIVSTTPSPINVCAGTPVTISGSGTNTISISNGVTNNLPFTPTASGVYTVWGADANGCSISNTVLVSVNALPAIGIAASPNSVVYCQNSFVSLTASGGNVYAWTGGTGTVNNGAPFQITTSTVYTVTATSTAGCTNTSTKSITMSGVSAGIVSNPVVPNLCTGQSITLTGTGGNTYVWTGTVVNGVGFVPAGNNIYTVTAKDIYNCTSTATIAVTINSGATLNIVKIPASGNVCTGKQATIQAVSNVPITISNGITNNTAFNIASNTTYTVTASNGPGCSTTATVSFVVVSNPTISINQAPLGLICEGNNVTLNGVGASTYSWNGGVVNGSPYPINLASNFTVTGTDANGCTNTSSTNVSTKPQATVNITTTPSVFPICTGSPLTLNATGNGSSYVWSNSVVNNVSFASNAAINYYVTATNSNGCTKTVLAPITISPMPGAISTSITPANGIICEDGNYYISASSVPSNSLVITGAYNPVLSTSTPWNPQPFFPLTSTVYTLTAVNGACSATATRLVQVKSKPSITVSTTNLDNGNVCAGQPVTICPTGGSTYTFSPASANITACVGFVPVGIANTYTVTTTGANGCTNSTSIPVNVISYPVVNVTIIPSNGIVCAGSAGTLIGNGAQSITWSNNVNNGVAFIPTASNVYTVTGVNAGLCSSTTTKTLTITTLPPASVAISPSYTICAGQQATLNATAQAGTTLVGWSNNINNNVSFAPINGNNYTLTTTDGNCSTTQTVQFSVNSLPIVGITTVPANGVVCTGANLDLNASGASSFLWLNNNVTTWTQTINPTVGGNYTVVGTDANGCSSSSSVLINTINPPIVSIASNAIGDSVCAGSNISLNVVSNNGTFSSNPVFTNNTQFAVNTSTVYTVTATGTNGCVTTSTKFIKVNALPVLPNIPTQIKCIGQSVSVSANSPGNAISFKWPTNNTYVGNPYSFVAAATTIFTVTATNTSGCTKSVLAGVFVQAYPTISVASIPANSINNTLTVCPNTTVKLTATGGIVKNWTGGPPNIINATNFVPTASSVYTVSVANSSNNCTTSLTYSILMNQPSTLATTIMPGNFACAGQSIKISATTNNGTLSITGAGLPKLDSLFLPPVSTVYTVTSTNTNGCTTTVAVPVSVGAYPNITAGTNSAVICPGQSATLTAGGGVSYTWNNGTTTAVNVVSPLVTTTYTVSGVNASGCSSTSAITVSVNAAPSLSVSTTPASGGICPGATIAINGVGSNVNISGGVVNNVNFAPNATTIYTVTATNTNGCTTSILQTITVYNPPAITISANPGLDVCQGSVFTLTANGGVSYLWDNGSNSTSINSTISSPTNYTVTGTSSQGCSNTAVVAMNSLATPSITITTTPTSGFVCPGQFAKLNATGTATNGYSWSAGVTNNVNFVPAATGSYTVTALNSNGCTKTTVTSIAVSQPGAIVFTNNPANNSICAGLPMIINAASSGGTILITGSGSPINGNPFTPTATSNFTITSTDANGCAISTTTTIVVKPLPLTTLAMTPSTSLCAGASDSIFATGANTYQWTGIANNTSTLIANPSASTTYTVTGTSSNGCTKTASILINVVNLPVISYSTVPAIGTICKNELITINATAGTGNTVSISGGVLVGSPFSPSATTVYTITATNSTGCNASTTLTIVVNSAPTIAIANNANTNNVCLNSSIILNATGANTYLWSNGINNGIPFTITGPNTYTVTGTGSNGCTATSTIQLFTQQLPTVSITTTPVNTTICAGQSIILSGAGNSVSYAWANGYTNGLSVSPTANTTYTVTGTGTNGCSATSSVLVVISQPQPIVVTSVPTSGQICIGTSIKVNVLCPGSTLAIAGAFNPVLAPGIFFPQTTSFYTITATNSQGCTRTTFIPVVVKLKPTVTIASNPSPATICSGTSLSLTASGAITYVWSPNITNGSVFVPAATSVYTVTGTGQFGCTSTASVSITVNPLPNVNASISSPTVVVGNNVTLCATSTTSPTPSFVWSPAGITNCATYVPSTTGNYVYTVTATNASGCTATRTVSLVVASAKTNNLPSVTLEAIQGAPSLLTWKLNNLDEVEEVELYSATNDQQWMLNKQLSINDISMAINSNINTSYQLKVKSNGVWVQSNVVKLQGGIATIVYPNPVVGNEFNTMFTANKSGTASIKIINMQGKLLYMVTAPVTNGQNVINLSSETLPSGTFMLQVMMDGKPIGETKFVKQ
jgi:hypothetical protein